MDGSYNCVVCLCSVLCWWESPKPFTCTLFETLGARRTLTLTPNLTPCSFPPTGDHCFFAFCSLCGEAFHPGGQCLTPAERLELLEARTKGQAMSEAARQSVMQKKQALIHEALSMDYVRKQTKPCPTCRMAVSKEEGCNKMTCSSCGVSTHRPGLVLSPFERGLGCYCTNVVRV